MVIWYRRDKGLMQTLESVTDETDGVMKDKNQPVLSTGFLFRALETGTAQDTESTRPFGQAY